MAKGFKTGGRKKGSPNKPKELVVSSTQRAATAGNARVHAEVIPALNLTPPERRATLRKSLEPRG